MTTTDFYSNVSLRNNELRDFVVHRSSTAPAVTAQSKAGQLYYNTSDKALYVLLPDSTSQLRWERVLDSAAAAEGLFPDVTVDYKASVRLATTPGDLAGAGATFNSSTRTLTLSNLPAGTALPRLDGVEVAIGDRILVKDLPHVPVDLRQYNGIWRVQAHGNTATTLVLQRASDADTSAEVTAGMLVPVERGLQNASRIYQLITDQVNLDVTPLVFTHIEGSGSPHAILTVGPGLEFTTPTSLGLRGVTALNPGDLLVGTTGSGFTVLGPGPQRSLLSVTAAGTLAWQPAPLPVASGGTGLSSIAVGAMLVGANGNTFVALPPGNLNDVLVMTPTGPAWQAPAASLRRFVDTTTIDGTASQYVITHNLGTRSVVVSLWDTANPPYEQIQAAVAVLDDNRIRVSFTSNQGDVRVVVIG